MKMSMTHATIERNAAMQEMKKLHKKANLMEKELEQVRVLVHVSQEVYFLETRASVVGLFTLSCGSEDVVTADVIGISLLSNLCVNVENLCSNPVPQFRSSVKKIPSSVTYFKNYLAIDSSRYICMTCLCALIAGK